MEIIGRAPLLTPSVIGHLLLMMILFPETIVATNKHHCPPSSCGNLRNIGHPFRLTTDPRNCGDSRYELSCENNFTTIRINYRKANAYYLAFDQHKFYVHGINYNNYTIRIADPNFQKENCSSIPAYSLSTDTLWWTQEFEAVMKFKPIRKQEYVTHQLTETIIFLTCEKPVRNSHLHNYIDRSCTNVNYSALSDQSKRRYSYVIVGGNTSFSDLEETCRIDQVSLISTRRASENLKKTTSYRDIHDELTYGFELSWLPSFRKTNLLRVESLCYIEEDSNEVNCLTTCEYASEQNKSCSRGFFELIRFYCGKLRVYFYIGIILGPRLYCTILVIVLLIYKWNTRHLSMYDSVEEFLQRHVDVMPIRYPYWEIKEMSNGFKVKLGEGGFGSVYKGKLSNGHLVAIKMLGKSKGNGQDFINEVATIGRIHHVNVVRLIGFCVEGSKRALVFDFMPNGSLDKHVFSKEGINNFLSYKEMHKISLGITRGIEYLHRGCDMRILHFDIKPHNILLDENFIPKITDFGLARFSSLDNSLMSLTAARGTIGYIAPELFYRNLGGVSNRADVYSFGMLLMEMANKRKNLNPHAENSSQIYFPLWIYDQYRKGKEMEVEDAMEEESKTVKKMIIVALWCIQLKPCDRPSMKEVIEMLEGEVESLQLPPKPYLYPQEQEHDEKHIDEAAGEASTLSEEDSQESSLISSAR